MSSEWIENTGRKRAPFAKGTLIDVKYRGREPLYAVECGGPYANAWSIDGANGDIVAYRKHEVDNEQD